MLVLVGIDDLADQRICVGEHHRVVDVCVSGRLFGSARKWGPDGDDDAGVGLILPGLLTPPGPGAELAQHGLGFGIVTRKRHDRYRSFVLELEHGAHLGPKPGLDVAGEGDVLSLEGGVELAGDVGVGLEIRELVDQVDQVDLLGHRRVQRDAHVDVGARGDQLADRGSGLENQRQGQGPHRCQSQHAGSGRHQSKVAAQPRRPGRDRHRRDCRRHHASGVGRVDRGRRRGGRRRRCSREVRA